MSRLIGVIPDFRSILTLLATFAASLTWAEPDMTAVEYTYAARDANVQNAQSAVGTALFQAEGPGIAGGDSMLWLANFEWLRSDDLTAADIELTTKVRLEGIESAANQLRLCWRTVGAQLLEWNQSGDRPIRAGFVSSVSSWRYNLQMGCPLLGGALRGRLASDYGEPLWDVLDRADELILVSEDSVYDGYRCIELVGRGAFGELRVWIAAQKGFALVGYELIKGADHYCGGTLVRALRHWGELQPIRMTETLTGVTLSHIAGQWIPVAGSVNRLVEFDSGEIYRESTDVSYSRVNLHLDPQEVEHWSAFGPPDGTGILYWDRPPSGIVTEWRNAQISPIMPALTVARLDEAVSRHVVHINVGDPRAARAFSSLTVLWLFTVAACLAAPMTLLALRAAWSRWHRHKG